VRANGHPVKISVVTVCFNSAATIRHALDSFFAQDWPDKELVIVDGASTDGTLDIVASYPNDNVVVRSAPDNGIYDAMNTGLRLATGDMIGFLNSDDAFAHHDALRRVAAVADGQAIVAGHVRFVAEMERRRPVRFWRSTPYRAGAFQRGWSLPHPAVYAPRQTFERVGGFDTRYRIGADYDWLLRAFELHRTPLRIIDAVFVDMKTGGTSTAGLDAFVINQLEPLRSRRAWLDSGIVDFAFFARIFVKLGQLRSFRLFQ
jgi:glycosyltransferase involved in cell wall biosynthesis